MQSFNIHKVTQVSRPTGIPEFNELPSRPNIKATKVTLVESGKTYSTLGNNFYADLAIVKYDDGTIYTGPLFDGRPHGQGRHSTGSGQDGLYEFIFSGNYDNGLLVGQGQVVVKKGEEVDIIQGEFQRMPTDDSYSHMTAGWLPEESTPRANKTKEIIAYRL